MDKAAVFHATTEDLENLILVRKGGILAVKPWRSNSSASNKKKKIIDTIKTSVSVRTQNSKKQKVNRFKNRRIGLGWINYSKDFKSHRAVRKSNIRTRNWFPQ